MKVAFFGIQGWEEPILKRSLRKHKYICIREPLSHANVDKAKNFDCISVFIHSIVDKEIISKLPNLKMVVTRSTGFDHIDLKECKKRKIAVYNVPSYGENTVAEHTFALLLAVSRNIHKSYLRTIRSDFSIDGLMGWDLKGKTIGVIGTGKIGRHVIRIARGFDMRVLAFDHYQDEKLAIELGFRYFPLKEILKQADIITLHVPYTKENHHMINKRSLRLMKPGAIIINTARGPLIDTEALIEALDKKKIAGVGLDVIEGEELITEEKQLLYDDIKQNGRADLIKDHLLLVRDNVVFTPHIAFYSKEALERIIMKTIENIERFAEGKESDALVSN